MTRVPKAALEMNDSPPFRTADQPPQKVLTGTSRRLETDCPAFGEILAGIELAAGRDDLITLIGETGNGKTHVAQLIYELSPRRHEPFLTVASGTLPHELFEQELFGVDHGESHSTSRPATGRLLAARRGFLVIDEIDTLGSVQQAKLLHLIETGEFEPVGSGGVQRCQARLIVSSHQSLEPLVKQGRFSAKLWDQLGRHQFVLPPLRRRPMDIVPLARKLLQHFLIKHRKPLSEIDAGLFTTLLEYPWPGNVRELEWVLEQTVIHSRAKQLGATHLPRHIVSAKSATMREVSPNNPSPSSDMSNNLVSNNLVSNNGGSAEKWELRPAIAAVSNGVDSSELANSGFTQKEIFEQTLFKSSFHPKSSSRQSDSNRMMLYPLWKKYESIKQEDRHT